MSRGDHAPTEFTFALLIGGLDVDDDAQCDAYFADGLDDSVLEDRDGLALATFSRTAETLPPELIAATNLELAARAKR
jgi:hypothetical protein